MVADSIERLLAPNPGMMTGRGTNSYLLGEGDLAVVDPGPAIDVHLEALVAAAERRGRLAVALVTHWHPDHLPAALELKRRVGARLAGHPSLPGVDHPMRDGDRIAVGGIAVRALATPGHTRDSTCFYLEDQEVLFSGDHLAGEGTVVINPPDGDMAAYLDSLRAVLALDLARILPGHGPPVERPRELVSQYIQHRLERERQVMDGLAQGPRGAPELVAAIYADVPAALHPVAARSVLAHLLKLQQEGRVRQAEGRWRLA
jgi:glyoxylase-like metal-dependent hydrolase (beta-lactamase superfamily II)